MVLFTFLPHLIPVLPWKKLANESKTENRNKCVNVTEYYKTNLTLNFFVCVFFGFVWKCVHTLNCCLSKAVMNHNYTTNNIRDKPLQAIMCGNFLHYFCWYVVVLVLPSYQTRWHICIYLINISNFFEWNLLKLMNHKQQTNNLLAETLPALCDFLAVSYRAKLTMQRKSILE